jgi:hypothetical protein
MFPLKERYRMHVDNCNWGEFNYNGEANPSNSLTQQHIVAKVGRWVRTSVDDNIQQAKYFNP